MATSDRARWIRWRARRLESAGFPAELAGQLARWDRVDLHELLELIDRGCPPALAARILAPLDDDSERILAPLDDEPGRALAPLDDEPERALDPLDDEPGRP